MSDTVTTVILSEWLVDEALSRPFNLIMWFIVRCLIACSLNLFRFLLLFCLVFLYRPCRIHSLRLDFTFQLTIVHLHVHFLLVEPQSTAFPVYTVWACRPGRQALLCLCRIPGDYVRSRHPHWVQPDEPISPEPAAVPLRQPE